MTRFIELSRLCGAAISCVVLAGPLGCNEDAEPLPAGSAGAGGGQDGGDGSSAGGAGGGTGSDARSDTDTGVDPEGGATSCEGVVPSDEFPLIDDFEDEHISQIVPSPKRDGFWSISKDDTPGAQISPPDGFFPEPGGRPGSKSAAHLVASGFDNWGASLSLGLIYQDRDLVCSYNASKFAGLGFWAKGPGNIRVAITSAATVPSPDNGGLVGGECESTSLCWDFHTKLVALSTDWAYYEFGWKSFEQIGFGTGTLGDLNPAKITGLAFAVWKGPEYQPADYWIDDVAFVKTLPVPDGGMNDASPLPNDGGGEADAASADGGDAGPTGGDGGDGSAATDDAAANDAGAADGSGE